MSSNDDGERGPGEDLPRFLSVRQLAAYLQVNDKKIYALANEGRLPGTKVTGKWLFPRELIDRWLLENTHGGVLADRLHLAGGEDVLLQRAMRRYADRLGVHALASYCATGTRRGLALLDRGRVDGAVVHWGPTDESARRHPALLQHYQSHPGWALIHLCRREQGIVVAPGCPVRDLQQVIGAGLRWVFRGDGSGTQRYLMEVIASLGADLDQLDVTARVTSEREAAALLVEGGADLASGSPALAREFGLHFLAVGWEDVDLVVSRETYFRQLLRELLAELRSPETSLIAQQLGGYDLGRSGELLWTQ